MMETMIGFIIWSIVGGLFIFLGIVSFFSKKTMGFWANEKMLEVIATMMIYILVIEKNIEKNRKIDQDY